MAGHNLRQINAAERRAICTECGPVTIRSRGDGGWRCATAANEYKRQKRKEDAEKRMLTTALRVKTVCCGVPFELPPVNPKMHFHDSRVIAQEICVRCTCGAWKGISRRRFPDDTDYLTWIDGVEIFEDGRSKGCERPADDSYGVNEIVDLLSESVGA